MSANLQCGLSRLVALCVLFLFASIEAARLYLPRDEALSLLEAKEERLYFFSCDMSNNQPPCALAMDESDNTELSQCSVTNPDEPGTSHYWLGVLENPAYITAISILNMDEAYRSYADALTQMVIMVMDESCIRVNSNNGSFSRRTFSCDQLGDEITILSDLPTSVMTICEVEVTGAYLKFPSSLGDFMFLEPRACAMSGGSVDDCYNAINNETDVKKYIIAKSEAPVGEEQVAWFELYLRVPSIINRVFIYSDELIGLQVTINRRVCTKYNPKPGKPSPIPWRVICKYFGDTVRIEHQPEPGVQAQVRLTDVQAFGYEADVGRTNKYLYQGCYKDQAEDRDLSLLVSGTRMTADKCYNMCKREGTKYFGVQNGRLCFCGASFGKHGKVDEASCSTPCQGDLSVYCGGLLHNSVCEII